MASAAIIPRQLAPTVGLPVMAAGVRIRTGLNIVAGASVASGIVVRFGSLDCINDNRDVFGDKPFPDGGTIVSFGEHRVYAVAVPEEEYPGNVIFFQPCFYIPPSLRFRSTGYATTPPSVGAKGAVDQKNARKYPVGTLSNGRPAVNSSYLSSSNTPARAAGVQRRLELDHQVKLESNHKLTKENAMNQPWSRLPPPVRSNGNYLAKDQIPRAPDIAEKLSQLSIASNRAPVLSSDKFTDPKARTYGDPVRRPLPLGSRAWHAPNDSFGRTYEMPGERALLQRKLVS